MPRSEHPSESLVTSTVNADLGKALMVARGGSYSPHAWFHNAMSAV